jgi:hypothetical protein
MNEQKLTYVRTCKRCRQPVLANAIGMARHGSVCLRFDMRDRLVRKLQWADYIPDDRRPVIENLGPERKQKGSPIRRGMRGRHR